MKTILILMDSLNRHMLKPYTEDADVRTPNIERLAKRSMVFENHYIASAPCMPARRDLFTGRMNFLERSWGPIEAFDVTLPTLLRRQGVFTHMATDHYHYAELGGEGYLQQFDTYELLRGQESDPWVSQVKDPEMPVQYGQVRRQYQLNRTRFQKEEDFPTPRTFASAVQWLHGNRGADDFFLMVEAFDPHEPFDTPEEYTALYEQGYDGGEYEWSTYGRAKEPPEAVAHLRNKYKATLTMADRWLGKLLDEMDEQGLWEDTLVLLTSDHGHMLGEHGFTGKNFCHAYNEMARIPLLVHLPGGKNAGVRVKALTQNVDVMPTVLEYYGMEVPEGLHGKSWVPLFSHPEGKLRDAAIYGWFGMPVNVTDGRYTYFRAANTEENAPLAMYTTMPTAFRSYLGHCEPSRITTGRYLKRTSYPVFRFDLSGQRKRDTLVAESLLFDLESDPKQERPIQDPALEEHMKEELARAMRAHDAPAEQFERLGLAHEFPGP